ncbi:hypothetical protein BVRB_6g151980 [Beta vulgaris subsp. vulgaris]|nr:hypothetical protein BVRB_6g151980 [Beta vulgaris subsp. vulgaris]
MKIDSGGYTSHEFFELELGKKKWIDVSEKDCARILKMAVRRKWK